MTKLTGREKSYKVNFKKPGKDGMGIYRAVLISGPPGIGKTTSAHLMAKQAGYSPLELNASDARSKKLIEVSLFAGKAMTDLQNSTNIDNTSLDGFFQGSGLKVSGNRPQKSVRAKNLELTCRPQISQTCQSRQRPV